MISRMGTMMNNQNISNTWSWTCGCGITHLLRNRKCSQCQEAMPQSIRTAVYIAELSFQKTLHRDFTFKRSVRRMEKLNKFLSTTLALLIIAAALLTGYVCYDCGGMICQIDIAQRLDIAMLRLEAVLGKVIVIDLDVSVLVGKLRFSPERLMDSWEKLLIVQERLSGLGKKLEPMPYQICETAAESADQIACLVGYIQEHIAATVEYVQALLDEIQ